MNERIRELNHMAMSIVLNGNDPDGDVDKMYIPSEFTNKFAELIREDERMMACELIDAYAKALKVAILNGGE